MHLPDASVKGSSHPLLTFLTLPELNFTRSPLNGEIAGGEIGCLMRILESPSVAGLLGTLSSARWRLAIELRKNK